MSLYMGYKNPQDQVDYARVYYKKYRKKWDAYNKAWRLRNPEQAKLISKRWKAKNKDKTNSARLKYKYNISLDEYNRIHRFQNGLCGICHKESKRTLVVDHCHDSKKVRGLLCNDCNIAIGFMKDDVEILKSAIKYLKL